MLVVETIGRIRREHFVKGKSIKEIVRELKVSRNTVRKVLRSGATCFEYAREVQPLPKPGPWRAELDRMVTTNEAQSARERLTLIRLFEELRGLGYEGGSDAVRRYARARRRARRAASVEAYLALSFTPGEAYQFDWSHEIVGLNGVTTLVKVAHVRLCHSRMPFGDAKRKGLTPSQLLFLDIDGGLAQCPRQSTGGPTNTDKLYPSIRRPHLTSVPFHVFTEEVQERNL